MIFGAPRGAEEPHSPAEPASPPDAVLLAAHVAGDPEAFGVLVARHQQRLWAVAIRMMRRTDDAADALQDAYVAAFRHAAGFRGDSAVTTWLHRIVVNACLDRLRRQRVRVADPLPDDLDTVAALGHWPDDAAVAMARQAAVAAALQHLTPDQRAAVILVDIEGYPVAQAAAILGCAEGTVKSRCARGRARLLPLLRSWRDDDPGESPGHDGVP